MYTVHQQYRGIIWYDASWSLNYIPKHVQTKKENTNRIQGFLEDSSGIMTQSLRGFSRSLNLSASRKSRGSQSNHTWEVHHDPWDDPMKASLLAVPDPLWERSSEMRCILSNMAIENPLWITWIPLGIPLLTWIPAFLGVNKGFYLEIQLSMEDSQLKIPPSCHDTFECW